MILDNKSSFKYECHIVINFSKLRVPLRGWSRTWRFFCQFLSARCLQHPLLHCAVTWAGIPLEKWEVVLGVAGGEGGANRQGLPCLFHQFCWIQSLWWAKGAFQSWKAMPGFYNRIKSVRSLTSIIKKFGTFRIEEEAKIKIPQKTLRPEHVEFVFSFIFQILGTSARQTDKLILELIKL